MSEPRLMDGSLQCLPYQNSGETAAMPAFAASVGKYPSNAYSKLLPFRCLSSGHGQANT